MANLEKVNGGMKLLNQIALFVILGSAALFILWMLGNEIWTHFKQKPNEMTVKTAVIDKKNKKTEITLKVGYVEKYGKLWVAHIVEPRDSYSVTYRSSSSITRNVLITPEKSDKVHLLFKNYKNKFNLFRSLPDNDSPKVIVCQYVKDFEGEDDENNEKTSVMLLSPDAEKQKTIIDGIDRILKIEMVESNVINVIYFKQGKLINARYSINNFKVISEPAVFDLKDTNLEASKLAGED
jgi:hypothetical protein